MTQKPPAPSFSVDGRLLVSGTHYGWVRQGAWEDTGSDFKAPLSVEWFDPRLPKATGQMRVSWEAGNETPIDAVARLMDQLSEYFAFVYYTPFYFKVSW